MDQKTIFPQKRFLFPYIFSAVALFVMLIACINFMNLSTARSANRAQEVGMRKVVGADKKQLISQFLGETIFLAFPALFRKNKKGECHLFL